MGHTWQKRVHTRKTESHLQKWVTFGKKDRICKRRFSYPAQGINDYMLLVSATLSQYLSIRGQVAVLFSKTLAPHAARNFPPTLLF